MVRARGPRDLKSPPRVPTAAVAINKVREGPRARVSPSLFVAREIARRVSGYFMEASRFCSQGLRFQGA